MFDNNSVHTDSLMEYIGKTLLLIFIMFLLFILLGTDTDSMNSFLAESVAFFILTWLAAKLYLGKERFVWIFVLAYLLKLTIGVIHYLYFIDPNYFASTGTNQMLHQEFQAVMEFLEMAVWEKKQYGLFHLKLDGYVTHQDFLSIIAIPFRFFGVKILNIAPLNSFFSVLTAINIYIVCRRKEWNYKTKKCILFLLAFFPATIISSYFYRDIVGWAFMSIGLVLICKAKTLVSKLVVMPLAMLLFYLQRNGYIVLPIAILLAQFSLLSKSKKTGAFAIVGVLVLLILPSVFKFASNDSTDAYIEGSSSWSIYVLPIKIILGLIGPFPWSNLMMYKIHPAFSYYLSDYVMGCLNIGLLICLFSGWNKFRRKSALSESSILGILLVLFGLMTGVMHMTYISIGVIFLIPWFVENVGVSELRRNVSKATIFLVLLNIVVISCGLGGIGVTFR